MRGKRNNKQKPLSRFQFFISGTFLRNKLKFLLLLFVDGCNGGVVYRLLKKQSPYEDYLSALESTTLSDYDMVRD